MISGVMMNKLVDVQVHDVLEAQTNTKAKEIEFKFEAIKAGDVLFQAVTIPVGTDRRELAQILTGLAQRVGHV